MAELAEKVRHAGERARVRRPRRALRQPARRARGALLQPGAHQAARRSACKPTLLSETLIESMLHTIERYKHRVIADGHRPQHALAGPAGRAGAVGSGPVPLTPLRTAGLIVAIIFAALTIRSYRQGRIGNGDLLVRFLVFVLPLLVLSAVPGVIGWGFDEFSLQEGRRPPGSWARPCSRSASSTCSRTRCPAAQERSRRDLTRLIENLALEQFEPSGHPEPFAGGIAIVIPAYNEADNINHVLGALPGRVCGLPLHAIVIDDGSSDGTTDAARDGRRGGGPAAAQPRPGRGAAHRLPAGAGHRRRDRRDDGRRRPAPALGAVAAGRPDRRRRGRRGGRLARAGRGRSQPRRPRAGHQASSPSCCRC